MPLKSAQKWSRGVLLALASDGSLRDRVIAAHLAGFLSLQEDAVFEDYLPELLQKRIDALFVRLRDRRLPGDLDRSVEATVSQMQVTELEDCAEEMALIAIEVLESSREFPPTLDGKRRVPG